MSLKLKTLTGNYQTIKQEALNNFTNILIDTENLDLYGYFNDHFNLLNEKTIIINTLDYQILSTAESDTINYELWHNPNITWIVQEENEWETFGLNNIDITDSTLNITLSSRSQSLYSENE